MKSFNVDWGEILRTLPAWERLPLAARRKLEYLKPSGIHPATPLEPELEYFIEEGMAERSATGVRVAVPEPMRSLVKVLRAMDRARVWESPNERRMTVYLQEHFTTQETLALDGGYPGGSWGNREIIGGRVSSAEWIESFLACETPPDGIAWECKRQEDASAPFFSEPDVFNATHQLVRTLLSQPQGVLLSNLPDLASGLSPATLFAALTAALRYILVVAALDEEYAPRVGVWPPTIHWLARPPARLPEPVAAVEDFHAALLMEDMTSVLVSAAAEPIRLRANDGTLFARTRQTIAERLIRLPEWAHELPVEGAEERVKRASALLQILGFAEQLGEPGEDLRLSATRKGSRWLGHSDGDRLKAVIDPLRSGTKPMRDAWGGQWSFSPVRIGYGGEEKLRQALTDAFLSISEQGPVRLRDFLSYRVRNGNPLLESSEGRPRLFFGNGGRPLRREDAERLWAQVMVAFLVERLVSLGGVRLGHTREGELCFAVAEPGRYLLGETADFVYGFTGEASVIVQPNFEVVFLALAPKLEAQIARFSQRVGAGPGVMFRITRTSVLAAAEAGMEMEPLLRTLEEASSQPVPANVVRQLRDWYAQVRRVRIRPALLIDCRDAETAARVQTAAGKNVRELTPTLLEVRDSTRKARMALLKQLRASGVFVEG